MTESMPLRPETTATAFGVATDPAFGAVSPPLYLTSTFAFEGFEKARQYDYGRGGNPVRDLLAEALSRLEGGAGAVITASGMAAVDLLLGRLHAGALVVAPHDCYGGTRRLLLARAKQEKLRARFVDQSDEHALAEALAQRPDLFLIETPSNPLMRVVDIARLADLAHRARAEVAVDNTFLSPAAQTPIALGADYVVHSTTKFINGHSDVIGGAVVAADAGRAADLKEWVNIAGAGGAPFDAWLTLRGLRTLFARMDRQQRNAAAIAGMLARHPAVRAVHYPGLASDPSHKIARRQQRGFGAMLSFELAGDTRDVRQFLQSLRVFTLAESLGGVESLIAHPMTMTHASIGPEGWAEAGITEGLLRLSVGLEHEDDLVFDLERALASDP